MSEPAPFPPPPPPLSGTAAPPVAGGARLGWWPRAGATVLDTVITLAIVIPLCSVAVFALDATTPGDDIGRLFDLVWIPAYVLWLLLYYPLTMRRAGARNGQTWGRQLLRIRVVREDGYAVDARTAILRELVMKQLLLWGFGGCLLYIPTLLDVLWPVWDDRNQSLHDKAVDTLVVRA
jgi:uncharacterized RDD family membrane protein YckC